VISACIGWFMG